MTAPLDRDRYPLAWDESYAKKGTQWRGGFDLSGYSEFLDLRGAVLELGSGDGNTAAVLLPQCGSLTCLDISEESFDTYGMKDARIRKVVGDARQMPFRDEFFGAVFCRHLLTHAIPGDEMLILKEVARVLAPRGMTLIEVFTPGDMRLGKGEEIAPRTFLRADGLVWRFYLGGELDGLVRQAGLQVRHFQILSRKMRYDGQIHQRESIVMMAAKA